MNDTLGTNIMRLRKEAGLTQEQLANALGISYQAVSKWENGVSCPDISTLPLLADLFSVSIDSLFGRETAAQTVVQEEPKKSAPDYPWPDDDALYAVLFRGHKYIGSGNVDGHQKKRIEFCYEGPAINICSDFSVTCQGDVQGDIKAGGSVDCGEVGKGVYAGGSVNCECVSGDVTAGGGVTCDGVGGNVSAGGSVTCDDVGGSVSAGSNVTCDSVGGDVRANTVHCDDVSGGVFRMN